MFCPKCGLNLEDGAKFCSRCGTTVAKGENTNDQQGNQPANQDNQFQNYNSQVYSNNPSGQYNGPSWQYQNVPGRNTRPGKLNRNAIIAIASAAVVVIVGVVLLLTLTGSSSPSGTVRKFIDALNRRDMNAAIACGKVTPGESIDMSSLSSMTSMMSQAQITMNIEKLDETINGDNATVVASIRVQGQYMGANMSNTGQMSFDLVKENGDWKIVNTSGF